MNKTYTIGIILMLLFSTHISTANESQLSTANENQYILKNIIQVVWLDNNEVLLVDAKDYFQDNMRLIKYSTTTESFTPLINANFERRVSISVSNNGSTIFIFDYKDNIMVVKHNKRQIQKNMTKGLFTITEVAQNEDLALIIRPIKTTNKMIIVNLDYRIYNNKKITRTGKKILHIPFTQERIGDIHIIPGREVRFAQKSNNNEFYFLGFVKDKEDSDKHVCAVFRCSLPNQEVIELFRVNYYSFQFRNTQVVKQNNNIYFVALNYLQDTEIEEYKHPDLHLYRYNEQAGIESEKLVIVKKWVRYFDISQDYLVTVYSDTTHDGRALTNHLTSVEINVFNRYGELIYGKIYNNVLVDEFNFWGAFITPSISPDQKKILLFKNYSSQKPEIINTSDINRNS